MRVQMEGREERGNGLGEERRGRGRAELCVFVEGRGAVQVRLRVGSRGQVRTLPQTLTLIKALDQ